MLRCPLFLLLLFPAFLLLPSWAQGVASTPSTPPTPGPIAFNSTAYHATCGAENLDLANICGIQGDVKKTYEIDKLDTRYLDSKLLSETTVNQLATECEAGAVCPTAWDQLAVDRIKFGWHDALLRSRLCNLRPCLAFMLKEKVPPACNNTGRFLNFRAFDLLCTLADKFEPNNDVMTCVDAAVELLQYSAADIQRGKSNMQEVCNCASQYGKKCPDSCKEMIKKFVCLSSRCSIDSATLLEKFPEWAWYFKKEDELHKRYVVNTCEEEVMETRPFVFAVVNFYGLQNAIIAICISILLASLLAVGFFVCYRRAVVNRRGGRNRCEYTEMKEEL